MTTLMKTTAKNTIQLATILTLWKMGRENVKRKKLMEKTPREDIIIKPYEFGVYEPALIEIMGTLSSLMETILRNGIDVDPTVMKSAQGIINDFQTVLDMKKKYLANLEKEKENGN
jgi:hypothetical protein